MVVVRLNTALLMLPVREGEEKAGVKSSEPREAEEEVEAGREGMGERREGKGGGRTGGRGVGLGRLGEGGLGEEGWRGCWRGGGG
jgi:hypothetical protein